jgi:Protein of unknown function (DUF3703)
MKSTLRAYFETELREAATAERVGDLSRAWRHLERAHVLSQQHAWPHVRAHRHMFAFGWRRGDGREMLAQLARILVAAPGSWLGLAPKGNTGGGAVGIREPMPIPADLQAMLDG